MALAATHAAGAPAFGAPPARWTSHGFIGPADSPLPMPLETWVVPRWGSTADPDDIVTLCVASDESCRKNRRVHPMAEWITIEIEPRWLDFRGARETFVLERKPPVSSDTDSCCTDVGARDRRVKTRRPAL